MIQRGIPTRVAWVLCLITASLHAQSPPVHFPFLQNMQGDHATVVWSVRENGAGTVSYSTDTSYSQSVNAQRIRPFSTPQNGQFYQYQADLTGLSANTTYNYKVTVSGNTVAVGQSYRFTTPGSGPFQFLVIGDSGDGSNRQANVRGPFVRENPNFVLHVGDIAYDSGTYDEFTNNYFQQYPAIMGRAPFFTIPGNHEYYSPDAAPYLALNVNPSLGVPPADVNRYYSFDWNGVHFVGVDANLLDGFHQSQAARMLAWLENDLANTNAQWKVAYWHQTPYPIQHHSNLPGVGGDNDPIDIAARVQLTPIIERYGVQLVFTGHEHNYQRTKPLHGVYSVDFSNAANFVVPPGQGTVYVTSGGGGGVLHPVTDQPFLANKAAANHYLRVDVDGPVMTIRAISGDTTVGPIGSVFDSFVVSLPLPPPVLGNGTPAVNAASFQPALAPGALVSVFGTALATSVEQAAGFPLPTTLANSTVTLNGKALSLVFASPSQVNAALPLDAPIGQSTLRVTTPGGFSETRINITDTAPAIFDGAITHTNFTLVTASSPAQPGETIIIYMTGLGAVNGSVPQGQPTPSSPLLQTLAAITVDIGDTNPITVKADFAGLSPGFVDLYQVAVTIPSNLTTKIYPLRVSAKGTASNPQAIPVQQKIVP